jgi:hypothetical protein
MLQLVTVAAVTFAAGFYISRATLPERTAEAPPKTPKEDGPKSGTLSAPAPEMWKPATPEPVLYSDDEDDQSELSEFPKNLHEECKLVLVVRTDLGMTKGSSSPFILTRMVANS